MPKKNFKLVQSRKSNIVALNVSFMLLLVEIDLVAKEQSCKKDTFKAHSTSHVKIIFVLLAEIKTLYI